MRLSYWLGVTFLLWCGFSNKVWAENRSDTIPVLMYHSISMPPEQAPYPKLFISPQKFERQIVQILQKGYTPITAKEWIDYMETQKALPKRPILITFDDGYIDNFTNAYPILKKHHVKATIFVITNEIGRKSRFLSWKQLQEMEADGGIDIESHTVHHYYLAEIPAYQAKEELALSKLKLEKELHKKILAVAYPYGNHSEETKDIAMLTGYKLAFSTHPGFANLSQGRFDLHRIFVKTTTNLDNILN